MSGFQWFLKTIRAGYLKHMVRSSYFSMEVIAGER